VQLTVESRANALTVPRAALVTLDGKNGVFVAVKPDAPRPAATTSGPGQGPAMTARFLPVEVGIRDGDAIEIMSGVAEGAQVITTGSGALKDGDRIVAAGSSQGRERENGRAGRPAESTR
jgi:multidrug efflux pump subunit AcrA (membrane-fusion protein)